MADNRPNIMFKFIGDYAKSVAQYPNIKPGEEFKGYPEHEKTSRTMG